MIDRAQRRLLLALGASALLHGWLAQTGEPGARRATATGAATLTAILSAAPNVSVPAQAFEAGEAQAHHVPPVARKADVTGESPRAALTTAVPAAPGNPATQTAPRNTAQSTAAPAHDPTYYTARSLDVYPRALTELDLGLQSSAGKVRATVLIDESGAVNEVRAIEAAAADIEQAARDLLMRTRFTPAGKDGRIVKAQLLVSLQYGTETERR